MVKKTRCKGQEQSPLLSVSSSLRVDCPLSGLEMVRVFQLSPLGYLNPPPGLNVVKIFPVNTHLNRFYTITEDVVCRNLPSNFSPMSHLLVYHNSGSYKYMRLLRQKLFFARYWDKVEDPRDISGISRFISGGIGGITSQLCSLQFPNYLQL
jgi:hypothetical protein